MIDIIVVYNSDLHKDFYSNLIDKLEGFKYEVLDNKYTLDKKKGFKVKGAFSARLDPFVGIYKNKKPIKGFYTEAEECKVDNIINYLNSINNESTSSEQMS